LGSQSPIIRRETQEIEEYIDFGVVVKHFLDERRER